MSSPITIPETTRFYVLDTSVLVHNPDVLDAFAEHTRVVPEVVLEELDHLKDGRKSDVAASARQAARKLEEWTRHHDPSQPIPLPHEGYLHIALNHRETNLPPGWTVDKNDNRILQVCKGLADEYGHERVTLVSKDAILRVKARSLGLKAEDLRMDQTANGHFTGWSKWVLRGPQVNRWGQMAEKATWPLRTRDMDRHVWVTNQYLEVLGPGQAVLGHAQVRWDDDTPCIVRLPAEAPKAYGVVPKNPRQRWALDALLDERIHIVTLSGSAGTGKTLLALAAGLELTAEKEQFESLLVCRPAIGMGEDLGFLPGTEAEKIGPFMRPIWDNLRAIHRGDPPKHGNRRTGELDSTVEFIASKYIEMQAVSFLRGRTVSHQYLLIDEAQNLSPRQVQAVLTRVGAGTKVVLCGDPTQIDAPYLDERSNGLVYAVDHLKGYAGAAHITFHPADSERSAAARWVAEHF